MRVRRSLASWMCAVFVAAAWSTACAAPFDSPVTIVIGYPAGGSMDRVARALAEPLSKELGVPVLIENRPGDGGRLAALTVKKNTANDNVVLLANPAMMVVGPLVFPKVGYDPDKDFIPISQISAFDFAVAVSPSSPSDRLVFLVTWLWGNPENGRFGIPSTGSLPHYFGLMLGDAIALKPQIIGYKGSAPLMDEVRKGNIPVAIDTMDSLYPQHVAGKVRVLAVSGSKRAVFAPSIPTFRESGLKIEASGWYVIFAPSAMPTPKVQALEQAVERAMKQPALQLAMESLYVSPVISGQADTRIMLRAFREKWEPVVRRTGFAP